MPLKKRLKDFLDQNHVKYVTMIHSKAYTAQEIAAVLHVPGKMFAKTVILKEDEKFLMAVLPATHRINMDLFKQVSHTHHPELASEEEFESLFPKCEIGAMPPFGNLYDIDVYVATVLAEDEEIAFNACCHTKLIRMAYSDFERLVQPKIIAFAAD